MVFGLWLVQHMLMCVIAVQANKNLCVDCREVLNLTDHILINRGAFAHFNP